MSQSASLNSLLTVSTNVIMTGTGIVISASFGLSVVTAPPLKFQWSPKKLSSPYQAISNDRSLMSNTTEVIINLELQWASKVSRHLAVKFDLRASWTYFSLFSPETMLILLFPRLHRPQHLRNIELRGRAIRDLTLDAKSLRKSSFNTDDKERRDEDIETRTVIF